MTNKIEINQETNEWWWAENSDRDQFWETFDGEHLDECNWEYREQVEEEVGETVSALLHKKVFVTIIDSDDGAGEYEEIEA
jgi:hypothetical protein